MPDISNGRYGHERSRHCEQQPIDVLKIKLKLKRKQKNKVIRKKLDIIKLQQPAIDTILTEVS